MLIENRRDVIFGGVGSANPASLSLGIRHARLHSGSDDGNDELRKVVGNKVLESYLFHLISTCPEFEHIEKEIVYTKEKLQNQRSADVMTNIGDQIICFDSKSFAPKVALRIFSEEAYSADIA